MPPASSTRSTFTAAAIGTALIATLVYVRYGLDLPLLFHVLAEVFAISVAAAAFAVAWNTRSPAGNGYLLTLGIAYGVIALIDLAHMVTYKGMSTVPGLSANVATQLWLAGRYLQASVLVLAPTLLYERPRPTVVLVGYIAAGAALVLAVASGAFPDTFIEGSGLTAFKVLSEYAVSAVMAIGLLLLHRIREDFDTAVYRMLAGSILVGIAVELAFTLYTDPFGAMNVLGHLLRIVMYYLVYRAVVESALRRPYDVLFRELTLTADALRESEVRFRSTFEQATLGIAHVNLDGTYARVNRTMTSITGRGSEELLSTGPSMLTHPTDRETEERLVERILAGDIEDFRLEKRLVRPNGETIWVNAARTLLRTPEGIPRYFIEILEDITLRKQAEHRLRASRDLNAALEEIDRVVLSSRTLEDMLTRCVRHVVHALDADSGAAVRVEEGHWHIASAWRFNADDRPFDTPAWTEALLPALNEGEPVVIEDAQHDHRFDRDYAIRNAVRSVAAIPLLERGRPRADSIQGVILAQYHGAPHAFTAEQLEFCRKLASVLTIAVENANLYAAERRIADTLQTALLGVPERIPGIDVAHAYRSATRLARIGGDFYDIFHTAPNRIAFVIGDVSGKGIEAASLTAVAKSTFRAFAGHDDSSAQVVAKVNTALVSQVGEGRFITAVFVSLDLQTGRAHVVCAGHPVPLVRTPTGCREDTARRNPPLGVFPDQHFEEYVLALEPGDVLVAFSDGLLDAMYQGEPLGEDGARRIVDGIVDARPERIVTALLEAAEHGTTERADDVAIVAMRFLGPER